MRINTAGHLGFRLVLHGCQASRHSVFWMPSSRARAVAVLIRMRHLFCDRKLLESTAGHLFLPNLPSQSIFYSRKIPRIYITTGGYRGFGLIAHGCRACRHRVKNTVSNFIWKVASYLCSCKPMLAWKITCRMNKHLDFHLLANEVFQLFCLFSFPLLTGHTG